MEKMYLYRLKSILCVLFAAFIPWTDSSLVPVDVKQYAAVYATSAYRGSQSGTRFSPERAFFPQDFYFGKQFWQSESSLSGAGEGFKSFQPQIIYLRFSDGPRAIAFVSFDACTNDARGCAGESGKWRRATGPKDFDIVAAVDCDQYGDDANWIVVGGERGKTWWTDSPVNAVVRGSAKYRCLGIRVLDVEGEQGEDGRVKEKKTTVAHLKMKEIRCEGPKIDAFTEDWICDQGDSLLGDECKPKCKRGLTSYGSKTCRRDDLDSLDGHFQGESVCEFQCAKPEVVGGYLSDCSRPLDGVKCGVTCSEGGFTDLNTLTCKRKENSYDFRWDINLIQNGVNGHDLSGSEKVVCIRPQDPEKCGGSGSCAVSPPDAETLSSYLNGAKILRHAVVVSYSSSEASDAPGQLPASCPSFLKIAIASSFSSSSSSSPYCGSDDCFVAMIREGPLGDAAFDLGTGQLIGGCVNKRLRKADAENPLTVFGVLTMADGRVRNIVLVSNPSVVNGISWWIVGLVVALVVGGVVVICVVVAVRRSKESKGVPVPTTDPEPNPLE